MAVQYDGEEERKLHGAVIHSLANQYHVDEIIVRDIYESKLQSLTAGARIKRYLSVLAARHVKALLSRARIDRVH
jgi:hypothetical protein